MLKRCHDKLKALLLSSADKKQIHGVLRRLYLELNPRSVVEENERHILDMEHKGAAWTFSPPARPDPIPNRAAGKSVFSRPPVPTTAVFSLPTVFSPPADPTPTQVPVYAATPVHDRGPTPIPTPAITFREQWSDSETGEDSEEDDDDDNNIYN